MKLHLLSGFLGSGKTTAIQNACKLLLQKDIKAGIITNDQGSRLVDGDFFKSLEIPEEQVSNSCFCCNYNDLSNKIKTLCDTYHPDIIFAESVGSCTDLVATIFNPLSQFSPHLQVTFSTFADAALLYTLLTQKQCLFDENVRYIYFKQLEEAGIIVVSKVDLLSKQQLAELEKIVGKDYPGKTVHYQNSYDTDNISNWLRLLDDFDRQKELRSLEIDYDAYGSGEAELAWLDQEINIFSTDNNATEATVNVINNIFNGIKKCNYSIGHLKFLIDGNTKVSFTATTPVTYQYKSENKNATNASLLINARVQTTPEILAEIVSKTIEEERQKRLTCKILVKSSTAFKPGYPKPTYRIATVADEERYQIVQKFMLSLSRASVEVYKVGGMEELSSLYNKSGPGIENIVNTMPELGLVNTTAAAAINQNVYQIWVRAAVGIAEDGEIWLKASGPINDLFPFFGEYLIVVIDAGDIVAETREARIKTKIQDSSYSVTNKATSTTANSDSWITISDHKARSLIVYIVDPEVGERQKPADCGPDCNC